MKKLKFWFSKSLAGYLWQEFWIRYYFKFVLPKVREVQLDGIRLDVTALPVKIRNRLMHAGYEQQEKEMCQAFLDPNDSVLELGGAIGFIGLYCRKKLGIKNVVSLEANPRTVELLRNNYRLNGVEPVVWNMAVAERDGVVDLEVGSDFWENSILPRAQDALGKKTMEVPAVRIETLFRIIRQPANVLIVDIEGAEQYLDVEQIPESVDKIIIEFHPKIIGPERMYGLIAGLIGRGFFVAREMEGTFVFIKTARRKNIESLAESLAVDSESLGVTAGAAIAR